MGVEDFTTYTELDPNSHILVNTNQIDHTTWRNEDARVYDDKGAAYFGNFTHEFTASLLYRTNFGLGVVWSVTNVVDDLYALDAAKSEALSVDLYCSGTGSNILQLRDSEGVTIDQWSGVSLNTDYYCRVVRFGANLTLYVYSDAARTNLLASLSIAISGSRAYRYVMAVNTYNSGDAIYAATRVNDLDLAAGGSVILPPSMFDVIGA